MESQRSNLDGRLVEKLRNQLEKRAAALSRSIFSEHAQMLESQDDHHLADIEEGEGEARNERAVYEVLETESREVWQIQRALEAIADGTYGVCEDCDEPILEARLIALPLATRCTACQEAHEQTANA